MRVWWGGHPRAGRGGDGGRLPAGCRLWYAAAMDHPASRLPLTDATSRRFGALVALEWLVQVPEGIHAARLEGEDAFLEPVFAFMRSEALVTLDADDRCRPTPLGRQACQRSLHQQQSYLAHFDVFAGVDLAAGTFADPEADDLSEPRWADLRVAVAEYKGVDPYRLVFMSMLAGGAFFGRPGWQFDILPGSSFFRELETLVRSQLGVHDLDYEDEDGTAVAGQDVLEDVILQGARLTQAWLADERHRQANLLDALEALDAGEDNDGVPDPDAEPDAAFTVALVPYDPWGAAAAYAGSASYVEPLWLGPYW